MIPSVEGFLNQDYEIQEQPSLTYRMDLEKKTIVGLCDEQEAMRQAIYKILSTERFVNIIYSWNYGVELVDLFGQPASIVCPEIKRLITEALLQDTRIESVDGFDFEIEQKKVKVSFEVSTVYGNIEVEREVNF